MIATITRAMWLTEENAIRDFKLVWRKQIELVIIIPHRDNIRKGYAMKFVIGLSRIVTRSIP